MAFDYDTLPARDANNCFEQGSKKLILKKTPTERKEGILTVDACALEVVAAALYQYLLGAPASPACHMVMKEGSPYTVASEYVASRAIDSANKDQIKAALLQMAQILAAAFLLGESDLNPDSIRFFINAEGFIQVLKIDHDHSFSEAHPIPLEATAVISLFDIAHHETDWDLDDEAQTAQTLAPTFLKNWCGVYEPDFGVTIKNQLKTADVATLNAAANTVFQKFAALTPGMITEMVTTATPGHSSIPHHIDWLTKRVAECQTFLATHSEGVKAYTEAPPTPLLSSAGTLQAPFFQRSLSGLSDITLPSPPPHAKGDRGISTGSDTGLSVGIVSPVLKAASLAASPPTFADPA